MRKHLYLFILLFGSSAEVISQSDVNELDARYTPPKGSIFDMSTQKMKGDYSAKNTLTFSPLLLARGQAAFSYQRALGYSGIALGAQIGFGVFRDLIHGFYVSDLGGGAVDSGIETARGLGDVYSLSEFKSQAPSFQGSLKYYYNGGGKAEGGALELSVRFQRESFSPSESGGWSGYNSINFNTSTPFDVRHTTFMLAWGETTTGSGKVSFINHLSVGAGVRIVRFPLITIETFPDENGFGANADFTISNTRTLSQVMPVIYIGWAIGAGW